MVIDANGFFSRLSSQVGRTDRRGTISLRQSQSPVLCAFAHARRCVNPRPPSYWDVVEIHEQGDRRNKLVPSMIEVRPSEEQCAVLLALSQLHASLKVTLLIVIHIAFINSIHCHHQFNGCHYLANSVIDIAVINPSPSNPALSSIALLSSIPFSSFPSSLSRSSPPVSPIPAPS